VLVAPLVDGGREPEPVVVCELPASSPVTVAGPAAARVRLYVRHSAGWTSVRSGEAVEGLLGIAALIGPGPRHFELQVGGKTAPGVVAPVLLTSSLDPVELVVVKQSPLTQAFVQQLAAHCPAPIVTVDGGDALGDHWVRSDLWIQDAVEFAVTSRPGSLGPRQETVALLGLRGEHDMGLRAGLLDAAVAAWVSAALPGSIPYHPGMPLPRRRWIDWYGNLEVTPPVEGYPFGRVLVGKQGPLGFHPEVLAFLEHQSYQWPPVEVDTSWTVIGHVDEVVQFVPAPDPPGFKVLLPSPERARELLDGLSQEPRPPAPSLDRLAAAARSAETDRIMQAVASTRDSLMRELGLSAGAFVELPALFAEGKALLPNPVNCLVVGRTLFVPDPLFPPIQSHLRARLEPLGLDVRFLDVWDAFHVRGGEIHCGTNAVRRLRDSQWWSGSGNG
jgi:protein-arginine deiminase